MSALLLSTSVLIFLIGLVSEQITSLIYNQGNTATPLPLGGKIAEDACDERAPHTAQPVA